MRRCLAVVALLCLLAFPAAATDGDWTLLAEDELMPGTTIAARAPTAYQGWFVAACTDGRVDLGLYDDNPHFDPLSRKDAWNLVMAWPDGWQHEPTEPVRLTETIYAFVFVDASAATGVLAAMRFAEDDVEIGLHSTVGESYAWHPMPPDPDGEVLGRVLDACAGN